MDFPHKYYILMLEVYAKQSADSGLPFKLSAEIVFFHVSEITFGI